MNYAATIRDWHYVPPTTHGKHPSLGQTVDECIRVLEGKNIRHIYHNGDPYITVFSSVDRPYVYYWEDGQWASYKKRMGESKHFTHTIKEFTNHYLNRYSGEKVVHWPNKRATLPDVYGVKRKVSSKKAVKKTKAVKKKSSKAPPAEAKFLVTFEVTPTEASRLMESTWRDT